jgi:ammonium transporter, Amt family
MIKKFLFLIALFGALGAGTGVYADDGSVIQPAEMMLAQSEEAMGEAPMVAAEEAVAEEEAPTLDSGNTAWMIMATVLVIMMAVPGLALFYGGLVRAKNMLSVLMQVFATFALMSILWALFGYSLAFTEGPFNSIIGGFGKSFLSGVTPDSISGSIPEYVFITFQLTFAAITPALIVGAFAERIKFSAVLWFMSLWLFLCYIPIAHMVWGGGFLAGLGAMDFAGGTVVHINAGVAALVGCLVLGKRIGYGKEAMPPHNPTFTMVGASLLWVGWFGFNVGSELAADGVAGLVLVNTQLATAAAVLGWLFIEWIVRGKPTMLGGASGAIAGLVAITPACAFVGPMGAIILGIVAGVVCFWAVSGLKRMFGYDDSLDVFGVHGVGGIVGAIGVGFLAAPGFGGTGFADGVTMGEQVVTQIISVVVTLVWTGIISYILFKIIDATIGLRVPEDQEREGLDSTQHGEAAYHM